MSENKPASISKGHSYQEIGEYWDSHDLGEFWEQTRPAHFKAAIRSQATYCPVETELASKLRAVAQQRGISAETLVNLWLQERLAEGEKAH